MIIEEWKDVVGFESLYKISNLGRVLGVKRNGTNGGILTGSKTHHGGYRKVTLCREGPKFTRTVHRLVLEAFVGPCPDGMEACHNDGNPQNNALSNLRWDTRIENFSDKKIHGTQCMGETQGRSKLTNGCVARIKDMLVCGETQTAIAAWFGVSGRTISLIKNGRSWKHLRAA